MSYRDELEAARRRVASLEEQLAGKERELRELERWKEKATIQERELVALRERLASLEPPAPANDPPGNRAQNLDAVLGKLPGPAEPEADARDTPRVGASRAASRRNIRAILGNVLGVIGRGLVFILFIGTITGALPVLVCGTCLDLQRAQEDAKFTQVLQVGWYGTVKRAEGAYFAPDTQCKVFANLRGDKRARIRGHLTVFCGKLLLFEEHVDEVVCQLEETRHDLGYRYRLRCLSANRRLDLDTHRRMVEVTAPGTYSIVLEVDELSEARQGEAFFQ